MKKYFLLLALVSVFTFSNVNIQVSEATQLSIIKDTNNNWDPFNYPVNVKLNQKYLEFDTAPRVINERTMVPMRNIFEEIGATVEWNQDTQTVKSRKGEDTIEITIGSKKVKVNGKEILLDVSAQAINARTYVPVRFISEALNTEVNWDNRTQTVEIKTHKNSNGKLYNFSDFKSTYINLKPFLKQNGDPKEYDEIYNPAYEDYDIELTYDFFTASFLNSYDDYSLFELHTTKSLDNIPRNIKIGDSVETLLSKFPINGNYDNAPNSYSEIKNYIREGEKIIYYSMIESSMGTIKYDSSGEIQYIKYSLNFDTSEANSTMKFEIVNDKISSIYVGRVAD